MTDSTEERLRREHEIIEACAQIAERADELFPDHQEMLRANAKAFGRTIANAIRQRTAGASQLTQDAMTHNVSPSTELER